MSSEVEAVAVEVLGGVEHRPVEPVRRIAYNVDEAAAAIGVPAATLRDAIRLGRIATVNVGRGARRARRVVLVADLEAWLQRHRTPARTEGK